MVTAENRDLWTAKSRREGIKSSVTIAPEWKGIAETSINASPCSMSRAGSVLHPELQGQVFEGKELRSRS